MAKQTFPAWVRLRDSKDKQLVEAEIFLENIHCCYFAFEIESQNKIKM